MCSCVKARGHHRMSFFNCSSYVLKTVFYWMLMFTSIDWTASLEILLLLFLQAGTTGVCYQAWLITDMCHQAWFLGSVHFGDVTTSTTLFGLLILKCAYRCLLGHLFSFEELSHLRTYWRYSWTLHRNSALSASQHFLCLLSINISAIATSLAIWGCGEEKLVGCITITCTEV